MFDKIKETCPNRPENQELGPILGQNGDPDLIKRSPTVLTPTLPSLADGLTVPKVGCNALATAGK